MMYYIYIITNDNGQMYVGSTYNFQLRMNSHKNACINPNHNNYNYKLYTTIRENGGWDSFRKTIISECSGTKEDALIQEESFRISLNANLCCKKAYSSQADKILYRSIHIDRIKAYKKQWNINNREKLQNYCKNYYIQNKLKKMQSEIDNLKELDTLGIFDI